MKRRYLSLIALVAVVGCANSGNKKLGQLDKNKMTHVVQNEAKTKADVKRIFGDPNDIDFDQNGQEKWTYMHTKRSVKAQNFIPIVSWFSRGTNDVNKKVVFVFDQEGKVINSAMSEAKGETTEGLLG